MAYTPPAVSTTQPIIPAQHISQVVEGCPQCNAYTLDRKHKVQAQNIPVLRRNCLDVRRKPARRERQLYGLTAG